MIASNFEGNYFPYGYLSNFAGSNSEDFQGVKLKVNNCYFEKYNYPNIYETN